MNITTCSGNVYSYIRRTNEIVSGIVEEQGFEWNFAPLSAFSAMPEIYMFIIGVTEQCNLRCSYCCYSGSYENNRSHGLKSMTCGDMDEVYDFILQTATRRPLHIAFYGGEPLLQYPLIQNSVLRGRELFGNDVLFSITTNATLLTPDKIDWLIGQNIEIVISLDGPRSFHDKHRIFENGNGSFDKVRDALEYLMECHPQQRHLVSLQMTLPTYRDIEIIAEEWNQEPILSRWEPTNIHGVAANFSHGVEKVNYEEIRTFYSHLLDVYEKHQDWIVLKVLLEECISLWRDRPILEVGSSVPMATCMPVNTKLFIDANKRIGVCEKMADKYRIGEVRQGIEWSRANALVREYYVRRQERCKHCKAVRMCSMCLTAIEYSNEQWDVLCHNENVYTRVFMFVFCEMVERGLVR